MTWGLIIDAPSHDHRWNIRILSAGGGQGNQVQLRLPPYGRSNPGLMLAKRLLCRAECGRKPATITDRYDIMSHLPISSALLLSHFRSQLTIRSERPVKLAPLKFDPTFSMTSDDPKEITAPVFEAKRLLSIQSHVVSGYVGECGVPLCAKGS